MDNLRPKCRNYPRVGIVAADTLGEDSGLALGHSQPSLTPAWQSVVLMDPKHVEMGKVMAPILGIGGK